MQVEPSAPGSSVSTTLPAPKFGVVAQYRVRAVTRLGVGGLSSVCLFVWLFVGLFGCLHTRRTEPSSGLNARAAFSQPSATTDELPWPDRPPAPTHVCAALDPVDSCAVRTVAAVQCSGL